jgi:hypothetical protein
MRRVSAKFVIRQTACELLSSADVARRLILIAKREKFSVCCQNLTLGARSVAAARSLCWLARYLKSLVSF